MINRAGVTITRCVFISRKEPTRVHSKNCVTRIGNAIIAILSGSTIHVFSVTGESKFMEKGAHNSRVELPGIVTLKALANSSPRLRFGNLGTEFTAILKTQP